MTLYIKTLKDPSILSNDGIFDPILSYIGSNKIKIKDEYSHIIFDDNFNEKIDDVVFGSKLEKITFGESFDQYFCLEFPNSLNIIEFKNYNIGCFDLLKMKYPTINFIKTHNKEMISKFKNNPEFKFYSENELVLMMEKYGKNFEKITSGNKLFISNIKKQDIINIDDFLYIDPNKKYMYLHEYSEDYIVQKGYYTSINDLIINITDSQFSKLYLHSKFMGLKTIKIKNCKTKNSNNEFYFNKKLLDSVYDIYIDDTLVYVNKERQLNEKLDSILDKLTRLKENNKIKTN